MVLAQETKVVICFGVFRKRFDRLLNLIFMVCRLVSSVVFCFVFYTNIVQVLKCKYDCSADHNQSDRDNIDFQYYALI